MLRARVSLALELLKHSRRCSADLPGLAANSASRPLALTFGRGLADKASLKQSNTNPVTLKTLLLTLFAGAGIVTAARQYEQTKIGDRMVKSQQVVGKAAVGGPFSLTDMNGKPFTEKNLLGEFALLYFGFTFCPDICPDELEKMAEALDIVDSKTERRVQPVFISVDPERDTPEKVKAYVKEFHPRLIGLTGDVDSVKRASKAYRVYYHKTDDSPTDYLVDHSIIMYLIDPEGDFVTFFGKNFTSEQLATSILEHMQNWKKA